MLDTSSERFRASSGETVSNSRIFKKMKPKSSGGYDFASGDETEEELGIPDSVLKKVNFAKVSSPTSGGGSVVKTNMVLSFMFDKVE